MNRQEAAVIIAQAAAELKAAKPTDAQPDRVATALRKNLLKGTAGGEAADRGRAALSSDEFTAVVATNAAQAVAARPERQPSPSHIDRDEMLSILGDEMQNAEVWK